jgi:integrase
MREERIGLKGIEKPGVNILKNIMKVAHFERILQACAASEEFRSILPVLVSQGLTGVRACELVGKQVNQPDVVYWTDFNWAKGWLKIRDEVAKQTTRKAGDQRWVTLPPRQLNGCSHWPRHRAPCSQAIGRNSAKSKTPCSNRSS